MNRTVKLPRGADHFNSNLGLDRKVVETNLTDL
ncbi:hypothetical protein PSJ8397_01467 [Pseudooctadecabacter jejudonensis]|uniref:Uncharacterized protein n=1 Tax=Pseudooctadecabacter jejudonensis TaxID=1391910 RepID=A0A1Y5S4Q2_9RHOB|nr:hypothetical protein PSJ8397_01467 [Pseudooctadecabacter jejudonensis]